MADNIRFRDSCQSIALLTSSTSLSLDVLLWHRHEHRVASTLYCDGCVDKTHLPFFTPALLLAVKLPSTCSRASGDCREHPELVKVEAVGMARAEASDVLNSTMRTTARAVQARTHLATGTVKPYIATPRNQPQPHTLVSRGLFGCHGPWCRDVPQHSEGACSIALSVWLYSLQLSDASAVHRRCVAGSYVATAVDSPETHASKFVGEDAYSGYEMFHEAAELWKFVTETLAESHALQDYDFSVPFVVDAANYLDFRLADSGAFFYPLIYAARFSREVVPQLLTTLVSFRHDPVQALFCAVNDVASLPYDLAHGEPNYFTSCAMSVELGQVCDHLSTALHKCAQFYVSSDHKWYARSIVATLFQQVVDPRYAVALNSRGSINKFVMSCDRGCSKESLCEWIVRWLGFGEASMPLDEVLKIALQIIRNLCPEMLSIIYGLGSWPYAALETLPNLNLAKEWFNITRATFALSLLASDGALGKFATIVPTLLSPSL